MRIFSSAAAPSAFADVHNPEITYYNLNENQIGIGSIDYEFSIGSDGNATATSKSTGKTESLPATATDSNGAPVQLKYMVTKRGELVVSAVKDNQGVATRSVAKCAVGTIGSAGAGAVAGGLGGAAVGTVTLPLVGTVSAGVVGAVGGGVFGGMTGAAQNCFD